MCLWTQNTHIATVCFNIYYAFTSTFRILLYRFETIGGHLESGRSLDVAYSSLFIALTQSTVNYHLCFCPFSSQCASSTIIEPSISYTHTERDSMRAFNISAYRVPFPITPAKIRSPQHNNSISMHIYFNITIQNCYIFHLTQYFFSLFHVVKSSSVLYTSIHRCSFYCTHDTRNYFIIRVEKCCSGFAFPVHTCKWKIERN